MRNRYLILKIKLLFYAIFQGRVTFRKILNVLVCTAAFLLRNSRSGKFPFILSLEVGNECNANCLFCRDAQGKIYDINPNPIAGQGIKKGVMPSAMALDIIEQVKHDALIVVLYTNGEPLLYKDLPKLISACAQRKLLCMIATNGLLLNDRNDEAILAAGIDFIKIQMSGFTQDIYSVQVRFGNVETLKQNIRRLVAKRDRMKSRVVLMLDFILYAYNRHQLPLVKEFCHELGIMLNVRQGNPRGGLEGKESELSADSLPLSISCDWPWKGMQVNFNGDILLCCDGVTFSGIKPYAVYQTGQSAVSEIWNGEEARRTRSLLMKDGRKAIPVCALCYRKDIAFKW